MNEKSIMPSSENVREERRSTVTNKYKKREKSLVFGLYKRIMTSIRPMEAVEKDCDKISQKGT